VLREAEAPLWYSGCRAEGAATSLTGAELNKVLNAWFLLTCLLEEKTIYKGEEKSSYRLWKNSRAFCAQKLTILQKVKLLIYYVTSCSSRIFRGPTGPTGYCAQAVVENFVESWITVAFLSISGSSHLQPRYGWQSQPTLHRSRHRVLTAIFQQLSSLGCLFITLQQAKDGLYHK